MTVFFFLMNRRPPRSTRTDTLFPYTTRFRSDWSVAASYGQRDGGRDDMFMLEFGIELPLFTRNRQDRGVAARQAEYEAALATREALRRQPAARIRAALARRDGFNRQVWRHRTALLPLAPARPNTASAP